MAHKDSRTEERTKYPGIYARSDGAYLVRFKERGRSRKRVFRTMALAREFKGQLDGGGGRQPESRQTVASYYEGWIDTYRGRTARGLDEETRTEYRRSFERHILPPKYLGRAKMRELGSRDISEWFGRLERDGVPVPTIKKAKRALSVMLATAAQDGAIKSNPAIGVRYVPARKVEKAKRRTLTADDVVSVIAAMPEAWQAFFSLLAESGCRVAELLGLRWRNVHLGDDPYIYVCEQFRKGRHKALKTEASKARVPLSTPMAQWLAGIRPEDVRDDAPVFPSCTGTPLNYSNVYNRVLIPALQRAGVGHMEGGRWDNEGVAFHSFRRACGSLLVNAGMDLKQVQQRLRHAQLATTLACYVEEIDSGRTAADTMAGLLWGNRGDTEHPQIPADGDSGESFESAFQSTSADIRNLSD
jgi:integrase